MNRAIIIGSGNVAEASARELPRRGIEITALTARNQHRGEYLASIAGTSFIPLGSPLPDADICIAAVSDNAISEVMGRIETDALVVHVSGARPLSCIPDRFTCRGVVYPLQTFSAGREVDFGRTAFLVEGSDDDTQQALYDFCRRLSDNVRTADSEQRARVHLAGVLACNFTNALYGAAEEVLQSVGLPLQTLRSLVAETAAKAFDAQKPFTVQTGPAARHDTQTLGRHRAIIDDPRLLDIYNILTDYIWQKTSNKN